MIGSSVSMKLEKGHIRVEIYMLLMLVGEQELIERYYPMD